MKIYLKLDGEPVESFLTWEFPQKSRVKFAHLEYDRSVFDWHGAQIPFIGFDELTAFTEKQFFYMMSRNRSTSGVKSYMRATCNPDVDSWVRKLIDWWIGPDGYPIPERSGILRWFVRVGDAIQWGNSREELVEKHASDGVELTDCKSFTFIPSKLTDNKILMEKDPGYRANLRNMTRVDRLRLEGGNWNVRASAGMLFQRDWFQIIDAVPAGWISSVRFWDRACFVAGTKIKTKQGYKKIEDIKIGDLVLTRKGFKKVKWSGISKHVNHLTSVIFSNGKILTGTRDHPIFTKNRGWIKLCELESTDKVLNLKEEFTLYTERKNTYTTTSGTRKIKEAFTGHCTEKCGKAFTVQYPMACISTTKTETGLITQSKILNAYPEKNTRKGIKTICHSKLISKIRNIEKSHLKLLKPKFSKLKNTNANIVAKLFMQRALRQNFVAKNVSHTGVPVYDLSVEDCHEFFANNILVHNSTKPNEGNKDPDWTRGLKMYKYPDNTFVVVDLRSMRDSPSKIENLIITTASHDTQSVRIRSQRDPGSAGVSEAQRFVTMLVGYDVETEIMNGDKVTRSKPVSAQSEVGNIKILRAPWNEEFFTELENFPDGSHDDIVDVFSGAFNNLAGGMSLADVL